MADNPIKRLVERRHPDHKRMEGEWQFLRQAFEGGLEYVSSNLFKHPLEEQAVYSKRLERAADHHVNLSNQVVTTYLGYLFQQPPTQAETLPDWLERFISQGDMEGRPLVELAKDVAQWKLGLGIVWVAVDKPAAPVDEQGQAIALSAAQELEAGIEPYAYVVLPTHILDGRIERGVAKWLLVLEDYRDDADPFASSGDLKQRFRLWTETESILIEEIKTAHGGKDWVITDRKPNQLGRVPFVPVRYGSGCGFASPGLLADIAHLDRAIFNQSSLLDEILYTVTFPQLCIPYEGDLYEETGVDEGGATTYGLTAQGHGILRMGLHHVVPFLGSAGAPLYLSPSAESANVLQGSIDKIARQLLGLALLEGEVATEEGTSSASGVSKSYTFEKLNRRLATVADRLEAGFVKVFELAALWLGLSVEEVPDAAWEFPESFEVRSLAQDIEELSVMLAAGVPSSTAKALMWKDILRKRFPKIDEAEWLAICEEIDQMCEQMAAGAMGLALGADGLPLEDEDAEGDEDEDEADADDDQE